MSNYYLVVEKVEPCFQFDRPGNVLTVNKTEPCMEVYKDTNSLILLVGEQGPAGPAGEGVTAVSVWTEKTSSYSILESDLGVGKTLAMNHTEGRTFTLPEITEDMIDPIILAKIGTGRLTITASGSDYVGFSTSGGSIYNDSVNTYEVITITPVYTINRWILNNLTGTWRR